jgi:hypothetical protein
VGVDFIWDRHNGAAHWRDRYPWLCDERSTMDADWHRRQSLAWAASAVEARIEGRRMGRDRAIHTARKHWRIYQRKRRAAAQLPLL